MGRVKIYDAFISYSHADCKNIAPPIQKGIEHIGKPWFKTLQKNLTVYRDETDLAVSQDLWAVIEMALKNSEYFVLLASPMAAISVWVKKEVGVWIEKESSGSDDDPDKQALKKLFIIVCDGEISWAGNDFDWNEAKTNCLPDNLKGKFKREPLWVDVREFVVRNKEGRPVDYEDFAFSEKIAKVIGGIIDKSPAEIISRELQRARKLRTIYVSAAGVFVALFIVAGILFFRERASRKQVESQNIVIRQKDSVVVKERDEAERNLKNFKLAKFLTDLTMGQRLLDAEEYALAKKYYQSAEKTATDSCCQFEGAVRSNVAVLKNGLAACDKKEGNGK
jgi:hypothetical protein